MEKRLFPSEKSFFLLESWQFRSETGQFQPEGWQFLLVALERGLPPVGGIGIGFVPMGMMRLG